MRRSTSGIALGLLLLLLAGAAMAGVELCADDCVGDGPDGSCALEVCCSCCVHSRFDTVADNGVPYRQAAAEGAFAALQGTVPSPEPRDILHVPKPAHF
jgi:hypothetical protein